MESLLQGMPNINYVNVVLSIVILIRLCFFHYHHLKGLYFFLFLGLALTSLMSTLVMMNLYQFTFTVETVAKYSIFLGYLVCINTFIAILPWNIDIKVIHEE